MRVVSSQQSETARRPRAQERIRPLAVLPVFYKLKGRRVLVAGGSDAAAWKAHLLAASGAFVELYASEADPAFAMMLEPDRYRWHAHPWTRESFKGVQLAVGDCATRGEARAFACAAGEAGVPVNVIDKPDFCDFQFGSIVNRSPAIVSISTDGAAPILGQAIRRRIESLLPQSLQGWAELARDLRASVNEHFAPGPQRRAFWERFVDRAFCGPVTAESRAALMRHGADLPGSGQGAAGCVFQMGAGHGDPELLTLKAVRTLQAADVIFFDDAISGDVLELARREARRLSAGRRGAGGPENSVLQTMIRLAGAGKKIVRLRVDDPAQSGDAQREITLLRQAAVSVQVVAGVADPDGSARTVSCLHRLQQPSGNQVTAILRTKQSMP